MKYEAAVNEAVVFLEYFRDLPDDRQQSKVRYPLDEILLLVLLGVTAGADDFVAIAFFGEEKRDFLRRFLPLRMEHSPMTPSEISSRDWRVKSFKSVS